MPQVTKRFGGDRVQTGICQFCGDKATLLCDMPKETEVITMKALYTNTCDNEMCEKCSIKFHGNDFCIGCIREIRTIWNNRINRLPEESNNKQIARKPIKVEYYDLDNLWHCPSCTKYVKPEDGQCSNCNQKLDWETDF